MWYEISLILISLILIGWIFYLEIRLKKFFKGSDGGNLEKILTNMLKTIEMLENKTNILENRAERHSEKLKNCIQKTAVIRFNPFKDAGGDQSFSIAALDDKKNGFVISSLFGREINRVYAKPLKTGESQYQLTEEEKEAIEKAS